MPTASARTAVAGYGKQVAEGTPLAVPKFETPMGGGFAGPERVTEELPWTDESQDAVGEYVARVGGLVDMTLPVLPVSSGSILEMILGSRTTTGVGPYNHDIIPADTLPFGTWFYGIAGNYFTVSDVKLGSWALNWSAGSPLEASVSGIGKNWTRAGSKWGAAGMDEAVTPFFTFIDAVVKLDAATTPAATTIRNVSGGSISVNRNLDPIQTDAITYGYVAEQKRDIEISLDDVVFEDWDLINTIFTGSSSGTTPSSSTVYGSFEVTFRGSDSAAAATRSLKLVLPQVLWTIDQVPSADPGGATLRYTVTGKGTKPAAGASITATLINGSSAAVY